MNRWNNYGNKNVNRSTPAHKPSNTARNRMINKLIIAISASILIGISLGMTTLYMLKQVDKNNNTSVATLTTGSQDNNKAETRELAAINVYVVQGGVFSEKENINHWNQIFQNENLHIVDWERDGQYYLFSGIADSAERAGQIAEKAKRADLSVFVKQWEVHKTKVNFEKTDLEWIQSFISLWQLSIASIDSGEGLPYEEWDKLIQIRGLQSERLKMFHQEIKEIFNKKEEGMNEQEILLLLLRDYETYVIQM